MIQSVTIIGTGNMASFLAKRFYAQGIKINQIVGRTSKKVEELAKQVEAKPCIDSREIQDNSDLYVIAVSDNAIPTIVNDILLKDKVIVHTSGSISMDVLKQVSIRYGVFYPFQTITHELKDNLDQIPILIHASDTQVAEELTTLAKRISSSVHYLDDEQRKVLHLSAIFVNNFTNHLFALAEDILEKKNINKDLIYPLVQQTFKSVQRQKPSNIQTGPARRNDTHTIEEHLAYLAENHSNMQVVYEILTNSIINYYEKSGST